MKKIISAIIIGIWAITSFSMSVQAESIPPVTQIEDFLQQDFEGVALKVITKTESGENKSHQREFNGVKDLRDIFGENKLFLNADILYIDDTQLQNATAKFTWYIMQPPSMKGKKLYRLRYASNPITSQMKNGDLMFLGKVNDEKLVVMIFSKDSTQAQSLLKGLNFGISVKTKTTANSSSQPTDTALVPMDIKIYRNIKTNKIVVSGKVSKITDGDTIVIEDFFKIRMYGMDAPEKRQMCQDAKGKEYACGTIATASLTKLIGKRPLTCIHHTNDKYGRFVFQCKNAAGIDINKAMVEKGMAVAEYGDDYIASEKQAEKVKAGIWQGDFVRPSLWRKQKKLASAARRAAIR